MLAPVQIAKIIPIYQAIYSYGRNCKVTLRCSCPAVIRFGGTSNCAGGITRLLVMLCLARSVRLIAEKKANAIIRRSMSCCQASDRLV